jgi:hypothetical protein
VQINFSGQLATLATEHLVISERPVMIKGVIVYKMLMVQVCTKNIEPKFSRTTDLEQIGMQVFPRERSQEMPQHCIKSQHRKCFTDLD